MADDHAILREGLKQLFAWVGDINVAGEAINGEQVIEQLAVGVFDILLLDMSMPGLSGIDLITHIRLSKIKLPILVLTMHNDPQIAQKAMQAGASGYITKDSDPEHLLEAIREVSKGGSYLAPSLAMDRIFSPGNTL